MAIDMEIANATVLVKIGQGASTGNRHGMIAATEHNLRTAVQTFREIVVDIFVRFGVVAGDDRDVAAIDDPEESQEINVVFKHVRKVLGAGLTNAGGALRGASAHNLTLIPRHANEADLCSHGADCFSVWWAVWRVQERRNALRFEGAVVQPWRIDVVIDPLVLMGTAVLMRHMRPSGFVQTHGLPPAAFSCDVALSASPRLLGTSPIDISCISRPVSTFGVGRPQSGQRKL